MAYREYCARRVCMHGIGYNTNPEGGIPHQLIVRLNFALLQNCHREQSSKLTILCVQYLHGYMRIEPCKRVNATI